VAQILLAATIWGAAYPLTKGILPLVPPLVLGFLRFLVAGVLLMIISRSGPFGGVDPADRGRMVALAFWGSFILVISMNIGLKYAPAGAASIISGTPPLFTFLFAWYWLGEVPGVRHFTALVTAMAGIVLLTRDASLGSMGPDVVFGIVLVTIPQMAWAIYTVLVKDLLKKYHWLILCRDTFTLGAAMMLLPALWEGTTTGWGIWNPKSLGGLLYLGTLNSVGTYSLWNRSLRHVRATTASILLYWQPVSGAILAYLWFGERFGRTGWIGTALVFLGLTMVLVGDLFRAGLPREQAG
jgi:drug/metabolite transporter (DMT)-like permease